MAGGQQSSTAQGTLVGEGGDNNFAVTGEESTGAVGTVPSAMFLPLRSRRTGGGTAFQVLTGQVIAPASGTLVHQEGYGLTGSSSASVTGTVLYRGLATISWQAVTTNANGTPITDLGGYEVLHGTTSGVYTDLVDVGNVTTYQWGGLLPSRTHFWVVRAYDQTSPRNYSGNSAQVSKTY